MLGLLMAGVLVKPVLAIACEIHDVQQMAAGEPQTAAVGMPDTSAGESCCLLPNCNDCCAHATAVVPAFNMASVSPMAASAQPSLSVEFEPIAFSVAFRPPIMA